MGHDDTNHGSCIIANLKGRPNKNDGRQFILNPLLLCLRFNTCIAD